jgi:hypothetical protein
MAEATATLERVDRAEPVVVLDRVTEAPRTLAETLRATLRRFRATRRLEVLGYCRGRRLGLNIEARL